MENLESFDINDYVSNLIKEITEAFQNAAEDFKPELFDYMEPRLMDVYKDVIDNFYSSYDPLYYKNRKGELHDLLEIKRKKNELSVYFEPSRLTYRDGSPSSGENGSLYDLVFRQGWHGGAASGDNHPYVGIPFYRTPYEVYSRWGRQASYSKPPMHEFFTKIDEMTNGGEFSNKLLDLIMSNVDKYL